MSTMAGPSTRASLTDVSRAQPVHALKLANNNLLPQMGVLLGLVGR